MNLSKLTLTVDKSLIVRAKAHAAEQNISLSNLISSYLLVATTPSEEEFDKSKLSPNTRNAVGLLASSELQDKSYKELMLDALEEKYGR